MLDVDPTPLRRPWWALAALALCSLVTQAQDPLSTDDEVDPGSQFYSVPDTRGANELALRIESHLAAERWGEAQHDLQRMLEDHGSDLLGKRWRAPESGNSLYPTYPGAAEWATAQLASLPAEAQQLYRDRYERRAGEALAQARDAGDRRALTQLIRRYPLTLAAEQAWWTLGDLELELGNGYAAAHAWRRAAQTAESSERALGEGAQRRLELSTELELEATLQGGGSMRLPGPGESPGPVPRHHANSWTAQLPSGPLDGSWRGNHFNLHGVMHSGRLYVSTSLSVLALDAHTSEELWRTREPHGWSSVVRRDELYDGIHRDELLIAPAAARGVVVAALQIPRINLPNTNYQGIPITRALPERRLHAFDAETGELLWDHAPPLNWDGESGEYEERMHVAGPPVIVGARVLVPLYRIQGRIDYHVGCFDLTDGRLLWSTYVVSGQRELNMFGRHILEFCAPPLRVEGDSVLALTQLGVLSSMELFTGRVRWSSTYEQIPLPQTHGWQTTERRQVWRNTPPIVADEAVIVAPVDSEDIVAYELATGAALWAYPHHRRARSNAERGVNALVGADENTLYLAGSSAVALRRNRGLGSRSGGFTRAWMAELPGVSLAMNSSPHALLCDEALLVPRRTGVVAVDRRSGATVASMGLEWPTNAQGNLLLADGALFSLTGSRVLGYFDWDVLLERARGDALARPSDLEAQLDLASLQRRRGQSLESEGRPEAALQDYRAAEQQLVRALPGTGASPESVQAEMHQVLRAQARVLRELGNEPDALRRLEEAQVFASDLDELRDTLLEAQSILRKDLGPGWLEKLAELERRVGARPMPSEHLDFLSDPLLAELQRGVADPVREFEEAQLSVGLWVRIERSQALGTLRRYEDELRDLHELIARFGARPLVGGHTVRELAVARIGRRLAQGGASSYTAFESEARSLLDSALAARDGARLDRVVDLYPHSVAAAEARQQRIDVAFEAGEWETFTALCSEAWSSSARPDQTDAGLLARLATVADSVGNTALARAALSEAARAWPGLVSPLSEHEGATLSQLAESVRTPSAAPLKSERSAFDEGLALAGAWTGDWIFLGEVAPSSDGSGTRLVFGDRRRVVAFDPARPDSPAWEHQLQRGLTREFWRDSSALVPGRVLVAVMDEGVIGIDAGSGELAWQHASQPDFVHSLSASDGVVLAEMQVPGERARIRALDAQAGLVLWEREERGAGEVELVVGDGRVVLLPSPFHRGVDATVLDLVRGVRLSELRIDEPVSRYDVRHAWVEDGLLVLPSFLSGGLPDRNHVVAYDLERGAREWRLAFRDWEELWSIARAQGETYLYLNAEGGNRGGSIQQLSIESGARREIVELAPFEKPLGLERRSSVELHAPYLFLLAPDSNARGCPVSAVRLPYGKHWVYPLPISYEGLFGTDLPQPAVSQSSVILAYTSLDRSNRLGSNTHVVVLDRETGRLRDSRVLAPELGVASDLEMVGLDMALFLSGLDRGRSGRLETWSDK